MLVLIFEMAIAFIASQIILFAIFCWFVKRRNQSMRNGLFRFNDAIIRFLIMKRDNAVTEASPLLRAKEARDKEEMRSERQTEAVVED